MQGPQLGTVTTSCPWAASSIDAWPRGDPARALRLPAGRFSLFVRCFCLTCRAARGCASGGTWSCSDREPAPRNTSSATHARLMAFRPWPTVPLPRRVTPGHVGLPEAARLEVPAVQSWTCPQGCSKPRSPNSRLGWRPAEVDSRRICHRLPGISAAGERGPGLAPHGEQVDPLSLPALEVPLCAWSARRLSGARRAAPGPVRLGAAFRDSA